MAFDRLIEKISVLKNPTVVGLDPRLDFIPSFIREESYSRFGKNLEGAAYAVLNFNKALIDALCDIVPAVKPQSAYYELFGWAGVKTLTETIAYAKDRGMFVILDGKRNDIGETMQAYAMAYLGKTNVESESYSSFDADALTVNAYLGTDGIRPLLSACEENDKGIFVLLKTSNPSSGELQDLLLMDGSGSVYEKLGSFCEAWGRELPGKYGYTGVGAVVGATYPEELKKLREALPHTFFLVPGYGAQGGGAKDVAAAFDENGLGAVVNSSRAILTAWQREKAHEEDFALCARKEALRMRDEISALLPGINLPGSF